MSEPGVELGAGELCCMYPVAGEPLDEPPPENVNKKCVNTCAPATGWKSWRAIFSRFSPADKRLGWWSVSVFKLGVLSKPISFGLVTMGYVFHEVLCASIKAFIDFFPYNFYTINSMKCVMCRNP